MNRIADVPGEPKYPHARAQLSCRTCVFYQTHCLARCPSTDVDAASEDLDGAVIRRFAPYVRNRYVLGSPRGLRQRWAAESVCWTALHISACISHSASPHILAASAPFHLSSRRHTRQPHLVDIQCCADGILQPRPVANPLARAGHRAGPRLHPGRYTITCIHTQHYHCAHRSPGPLYNGDAKMNRMDSGV
jgi:hypothetical protein